MISATKWDEISERLPFDRGFGEAVSIYWQRLRTFTIIGIVSAALFLLGLQFLQRVPALARIFLVLLATIPIIVLFLFSFLFFYIRHHQPRLKDQLRVLLSSLDYIGSWLVLRIWLLGDSVRNLFSSLVLVVATVTTMLTSMYLAVRLAGCFNWNSASGPARFAIELWNRLLGRGQAAFEHLSFGNPVVVLILVFVEFQFLKHTIESKRQRGNEHATFIVLRMLLDLVWQADFSDEPDSVRRDAGRRLFSECFVVSLDALFSKRGKPNVQIAILKFGNDEGFLDLVAGSGSIQFMAQLQRVATKGTPDRAFNDNSLIYIPSAKTRHGIEISENVYALVPEIGGSHRSSDDAVQSTIWVPFFDTTFKPVGIIVIASDRKHAFTSLDFNLATFAGRTIGIAYSKRDAPDSRGEIDVVANAKSGRSNVIDIEEFRSSQSLRTPRFSDVSAGFMKIVRNN